jgi:hypothetical protein
MSGFELPLQEFFDTFHRTGVIVDLPGALSLRSPDLRP